MSIQSIDDLRMRVLDGVTDWEPFGQVRAVYHDGLVLFNYSAECGRKPPGEWNFFERVSRGLILDTRTAEVVARPFDKFWNYGQVPAPPGVPVEVTEKMDGSLGILYRHEGRFKIATRGSFTSDQALWATEYLNSNWDLHGMPNDVTALFEIIYPENRVVVDYDGYEDLVLIGLRNRFMGDDLFMDDVRAFGESWYFALPERWYASSAHDADTIAADAYGLSANEEGYVMRFADGTRLKAKSRAYVELHRFIQHFSRGRIVEALQSGLLDELQEACPEHLAPQLREWVGEIEGSFERTLDRVETAFDEAPKGSRKDFALWVKANHPQDAPYLFALLDGKDLTPLLFKYAVPG